MHWDLNPEPLTTKANFLAAVFSVNLVCKEELNLLLEISLLPNNAGPKQGHDRYQ